MKIAIDSGPLSTGDSVRGIGVYARELIKALKAQKHKNVEIFVKDLKAEDLSNYDIVHFTSFKPFEVSIPFSKPEKTKFVLTIYDLIPLIYPKHYPSGIKGALKLAINKYLIKKNVDAIITISETSKKDICRFFGVNPEIVHAIYLAAPDIYRKKEVKGFHLELGLNGPVLPRRFALYVGDVNYNKNISVLLEACKIAKIPLAIAGKQANQIAKMNLNHAELNHLEGLDFSNTYLLGFVPEEVLVDLYNVAAVYVQPSLYEGFGLPVLEANAVGLPVVASKTQALVEIGDNAALFADPGSAKDFADKIKQAINSSEVRSELIRNGLKNAARYSWEKTADETMKVYAKV